MPFMLWQTVQDHSKIARPAVSTSRSGLPTAERMDWIKLSDLYSFYLSNARAEVSRL